MTTLDTDQVAAAGTKGPLIYRQSAWTRVTHWTWAVCLFFLLLSGLQIFNAHPSLYIGQQSGFGFDNAILDIGARRQDGAIVGYTTVFGHDFETTGVLGYSGPEGDMRVRGFPAWATVPSFRDLGTGRVIHFFFAWLLVGTLLVWLVASLINGHARRDIVPGRADLRALPRDVADHLRFRLHHTPSYNVLQKFAYFGVLGIALPLMVITGLAMSPATNAMVPWLTDVFGGRQSARTVHFLVMLLLVSFFIVHIVMVLAAGPINELRSMITGWYRTDPVAPPETSDEA